MSTRRWWSVAVAGAALVAAAAAAASTGKVFGAKADAAFKSDTEKASYAIGVNLARQLKTMASEVDDRMLAQGFNDARSGDGKARLTNQEISAVLSALRKRYQAKLAAAHTGHTGTGAPGTSSPGLSVFFKMDPRLTASYGGDRWVSPPTYTRVGNEKGAVIEARAQTSGATPKGQSEPPQWTSSDPAMVQVTPDKGAAVTITVKRAGASNIRITSGAITKELAVKAEFKNNALQVDISQHLAPGNNK